MSTQTKHIETVFDPVHNITEDEKRQYPITTKEEYLSIVRNYRELANRDLAILYAIRGNFNLMNKYLNRVQDVTQRLSFSLLISSYLN